MELLKLFWAFLVSNLMGYGGGPSTIPLIQNEVVDNYHWLTLQEFGDLLALGNALPGPIAPKMAGYIGYQVGGITGVILTLIATVVPSGLAMVVLYKFVDAFKDSPYVKSMTKWVQPIVAILLGVLAYEFIAHSVERIGYLQAIGLTIICYFALEVKKVHPALVVSASLVYGAIFLS